MVQTEETSQRFNKNLTFFNITGDIYELPNGASIGFAAGYEGRVESADYIAGTMQELGLGFSAARKTVGGTYEIDALYYEVKVPLVTRNMDIPFVEGLTLDFSGRTIENTLAGDYDVEALSVAWAVTNDITFRYSDQTAIKAPDIGDLFGPQVTTYQFASDPCDYRFIGDGRDPDQRAANCAAEGLPLNFTDPQLAKEYLEVELLLKQQQVLVVVTLTSLTKVLLQNQWV